MRQLALLASIACLAPSAHAQLYATDFSEAGGWTLTTCNTGSGSWAVNGSANPTDGTFRSAPASLNFMDQAAGFGLGSGVSCGDATSPIVDLSLSSGTPVLEFWHWYAHEQSCEWDLLELQILDAASGTIYHSECLTATGSPSINEWTFRQVPLDAAWGSVQLRFHFDTIDNWNPWETGTVIDDLAVRDACMGSTVHCFGAPQSSGAPGAALAAEGSTSLAGGGFAVYGSGFPTNTFAAAFAGSDTAVLPAGNGVRCISGTGSVRLPVAPTRDLGEPKWPLDLTSEPLIGLALAGSPLYVQTIYRDGSGFNFSDAIRLDVCD